MEVRISRNMLFEPQLFKDLSCDVQLAGQTIWSSQSRQRSAFQRTTQLFGGQGSITGYMNEQDIRNAAGQNLSLIMLGILAAFCLLTVAINKFSRSFVSRIDRINRQLSVTVQNRFITTLEEDYQDEIGHLIAMINQMIRDTRRMIQDVYESRLKQREYELKALQAQLNPHFLYNVLSAINWHALTTGNQQISSIVTSLSRFYRTALNQGSSVTTIENELSNIRAYLDIQLSIHNAPLMWSMTFPRTFFPSGCRI